MRSPRLACGVRKRGLAGIFTGSPTRTRFVHPTRDRKFTRDFDAIFASEDSSWLESRGVRLSDVEEPRWGSVTRFRLPGGTQVGLYQLTHPSPITPRPA